MKFFCKKQKKFGVRISDQELNEVISQDLQIKMGLSLEKNLKKKLKAKVNLSKFSEKKLKQK